MTAKIICRDYFPQDMKTLPQPHEAGISRESCGFVFQIECLRKKNPYDFMCSCHRAFAHEAISNIGFDKLHKLNTFQK